MERSLIGVVLGAVLAGCSSGGTEAPSPTPTPASVTTTPTVQGPPTGKGVPAGAFVTPADLGPGWSTAPAVAPPCAPAFRRTALASRGLAEVRGSLTETLATGVDVVAAVTAWRRSLQACGYAVRDDALGDAGIVARSADGAGTLLVTGTEEVLVVLHARGRLAAAQDELDSWADLALGTSCVAAPDGCH